MYDVSDTYKEQIKKTIRNLSYIKIQFGLVDPDAVQAAEFSNISPMLPFATYPEIQDIDEVSRWYSTLETNFWLLDGSLEVAPEETKSQDLYQAYISSQLSAESSAEYSSSIQATISFNGESYAFRGFSFTFDTIQENYPTEVTITGYLNNTSVYTSSFNPTKSQWVHEENTPVMDKIIFSFTKNKLPNRRLRIQDLVLGVIKIIDSDTLTKAEYTRSNDLMNTVIPSATFTFSFFDTDNEYNPDNPQGVWEYLETGQNVSFKYGYQLDSGSVYWIPGGSLVTNGTPEVDNTGALAKVSFSTSSRIQLLTDSYPLDTYRTNGITLYDLADTLLEWYGFVDASGTKLYTLHDKLKNYTFKGALPIQEVKQSLQLIANAGMCIMYTDRTGKLTFAERPTSSTGFEYTSADIMNAMPKINKYPYLKTLSVSVNNYTVSSELTEICSVEIIDASNTEYIIEHEAATNMTIVADSTLTVNETVGHYAYRSIVKVTGYGQLQIKGYIIETSEYKVSKKCNEIGEDCELENILICSKEHALEYLDWMAEVLEKRNVYSFDDRGFPEIDEADNVYIDTMYTDQKECVVTKTSIVYNGALSGSTEVLS